MIEFLHFLGCEMNSLIRNSATGNTRMIDKAFFESTGDGSVDTLCAEKTHPHPEMCLFQ